MYSTARTPFLRQPSRTRFSSYIAYELPVNHRTALAAIYAASQSTLSTGLNSVATSWTLDIQERLSKKEMSFAFRQKSHSMYPGRGHCGHSGVHVLANGEIKSAYEWFNGFWDWCWAYWAVHSWVHSQGGQCKGAYGILCGSSYHGLHQVHGSCGSVSIWSIPSSPSPSHW